MPFVKGQSGNPGGRQKGHIARITVLREDAYRAYKKGGGEKFWAKIAEADPVMFMKLLISTFPKEMSADVQGRIEVCWIGEDNDSVQTT